MYVKWFKLDQYTCIGALESSNTKDRKKKNFKKEVWGEWQGREGEWVESK